MVTVFAHPWLSGLFCDDEMLALWSPEATLAHMLAFEAAWSRAGHLAGLWPEAAGAAAAQAIEAARIEPASLAVGTARDGVCVPTLVRHLTALAGTTAVHHGATSQDVIDTATALCIRDTLDLLASRLQAVAATLADIDDRFGESPLMGRTRMQAALPITVHDRLQSWALPLDDHCARIDALRPRAARIQIGGAAGDRAAIAGGAEALCAAVAAALGLAPAARSWHAMRDGIGDFASTLSLITGTLGKMGQDICLMAQQGLDEIRLSSGGGSSVMAHKNNPVLAELLVTLARFNAVQVSGIHQALVHEQERSGAAWTLEWMILPQMALATGCATRAALTLLRSVERIGAPRHS